MDVDAAAAACEALSWCGGFIKTNGIWCNGIVRYELRQGKRLVDRFHYVEHWVRRPGCEPLLLRNTHATVTSSSTVASLPPPPPLPYSIALCVLGEARMLYDPRVLSSQQELLLRPLREH